MSAPTKAYACNCSICSRVGWLLAFQPATSFRIVQGADMLTDYQFGKQHLHHTFCRACGVRGFSNGKGTDGVESVAINLRCIVGLDATTLPIETFDGASL